MTSSNIDSSAPFPGKTSHTEATSSTTQPEGREFDIAIAKKNKPTDLLDVSQTSSAKRNNHKTSARQKRLRKFGQHATSLKFSATDFVALSCGNLKQHYQLGKLIHRGRPHNYLHHNGGGNGSLHHESTHSGSNISIKPQNHHHANVHQCLHKDTGMQRAVKVVPKGTKSRRFNQKLHQAQVLKEFQILQTLDHPNLLKMYECFEGKDHYYIIMDLCQGGDLCEELDNWGVLPEPEAAMLLQQLLKCLAYCHANGVVHCNVKPEHILLELSKAMEHIKLTDFGCAQLVPPSRDEDDEKDEEEPEEEENANVVRHARNDSVWSELSEMSADFGPEFGGDTDNDDDDDDANADLDDDNDDGRPSRSPYGVMPERQGTPDYWSPEVVLKGKTGPKRDVWAVGVLAYLMLSNQFPFHGDCQEDVCERIIRGEFYMGSTDYYGQEQGGNDDENGGFGYAFSPRDSGYLSRLGSSYHIYDDPLDEAFGDEGIDVVPFEWDTVSKDAKDFIRYLLTYEESKRPTAKQALNHPWIVNNTKSRTNAGNTETRMIDSLATMTVFDNVNKFNAKTKLKQAACTFIAAQLVLQHEREAIDKVFQALDTDHTGRLTKQQVQKGYEECFQRPLTDAEVDDLFERVDVAGSGYIEYSEFLVAAINEKDLLQSQRIQQAFSIFDKNGDGWIDRDDLKDVLTHFKGRQPTADVLSPNYLEQVEQETNIIDDEIIEKIIRQVDENGDGKVSYEEFMAMMLKTTDEDMLLNAELGSVAPPRQANHDRSVSGISGISAASGSSQPSIPRPAKVKHHGRELSMSSVCSTSSLVSTIKFTANDFIGHRSGKLTEHYEIADYIDEGGFGKVYVCRHKATGTERAVKVVQKSRWSKNENLKVLNEFELLKTLDHPNILKMYELFEDTKTFFIVMDIYKGGDLCDELDTWGHLTEDAAIVLMKSLLSCLNYLHSKQIVHRDVKADNILLESSRDLSKIRLIDFGLATKFEKGEEMNQRVGTTEYMAPEVVMLSYKGAKCDIWSCGVLLFLVLSDKFPFYGKNKMELYDAVVSGKFSYAENAEVWTEVSDNAKDFVSKLLRFSPDNRPTAEEALTHPWLRKARMPETVVDTRIDPDANDSERIAKEAATVSTMSALASLNNYTPGRNRLQQGLQTFIGSQLLLKEEKEAIDQVFQSLDITCNGRLSRNEVKAAYFSYFQQNLSEEELDELFNRIDVNKSGYLEYSEFVVAALNQAVLSDSKLRKAFDLFDKNGDGLVSAQDIISAMDHYLGDNKKRGDADAASMREFLKADRDGDGNITFEEFIGLMLASIGDGELTSSQAEI